MSTHPKLLFAALVGFAFSVGLGAPPLLAQTAPATQITPSDDTGTKPFGTYSTGAGDVNLTNGNLNLNLPLVSLPGRNGHNYVLSIQYDSKIWTPSAVFNDSTDITYTWKAEQRLPPVGDIGWRLSWPMLSDGGWAYDQAGNHVGSEDYIITMADGAKHNLSARSTYMDAEDGSSLTIDSSNSNDIRVQEKDGSVMHFPCCQLRGASKIEDSNGNFISLGVDTLGRQITTVYASGPGATNKLTSISYKDSSGATQTTTLNYTQITLFQTSGQYQTPQPPFANPAQNNCGLPGCLHIWVHQPSQTTFWLLTSVVLPDNTSYTFTYNGYGELTKITYPTGGYTAYVYGVFTHQETYWVATATNLPGDFREVTERHICRDPSGVCGGGGPPEDITKFTPTINSTQPNNSKIDVLDPLGYKNHYEFSEADTTYYARYSWPREQLHQIYSDNGTLLRTIQTGYVNLDTFCFCPLYPSNVVTTLNDTGGAALVTQTQYIYDTLTATVMSPPYNPSQNVDYENQSVTYLSRPIDNPVQVLEYNYGSGSAGTLARKTVNTFLKVNPVNNVDYFAIHIRDRKTDTQVFDSGTTKFSETQYEYDNYPVITASGAVQRDTTFGTGYQTRGNLTAIKRWRNSDGAFLSTQYRYDDAGNATKVIDPLNHTTLMSYADSWGNAACAPAGGNAAAYLTSVTDALSHVTHATYNSCTGTMASVTDPNSQTTGFPIYDSMGRLLRITYPDGGQLDRTFYISSTPFSVATTKKINSTTNLATSQIVDGLARVTQTRLTSDPDCSTGDRTDTTYDGLGRVHSVSNAYCSTSDPTYGLTTYAYDALNRATQVTHPDGTSVLSSYAGRATQVSDEGNGTQRVQRISQIDGLGRLTSVCEVSSTSLTVGGGRAPAACGLDIGGTGFLTTYQYDPLGNLIQVNQNGMNARAFTYDSLSHLKSASNPESGSISYAYDDAGNLHTKVGPKQNQTNPAVTVTTTYQYDALNRLTAASYNDGSTQSVNRLYDQASATTGQALANAIGRLTTVSAVGGQSVNLYSYDSMGRVTSNWQCTPAQNCSASMKQLVYNYDVLGDITSASNGFGVSIGYNYNTADRLLSATSSLSDSAHPANLMSNITYGAFGPVSASFGNGVAETRGYTPRGQVNLISDTVVITQPAVPGSGSVTISGSERTIGGPPATAATGSVTLSGSIQSTQVVNQPAVAGSGTVNISGSEQSTQAQSSPGTPGHNGSVTVSGSVQRAYDDFCTCFVYDSGTISVTVGGYTATAPYHTGIDATNVAATLASNLSSTSSPVTATSSGGVVTINSKTNGANTNYTVSTSESSDRSDLFPSGSFGLSSTNLSGGTNPTYYTLYDTGTVTATVNGFSKSTTYGQGSTTSTVASGLASAFNGDSSSPVTASSSGASLTLTSKATGASTNYSLSASSSTSQGSYFSQPSFTATATSSTLLGGRDATYSTLYDAGTISITVNGVTKSASYGQNSTLSGLASSLASAFNGDSGAPVTASTSGATVNLTTRVTGASTNYSLSTTSSTSQSAYFSHPSFSGSASGSTLTGGQDAGANTNDTGTVSITVNGFTKSTSYGQTSTASSIASALITAFNADSSSPVNTSVSGGTVTLTAKSGGAATNYTLSASSLTNQGGFTGTSFPASTSGANLTGGANSSQSPTTPYSVNLTFMPNGNVATANDNNVNGNWVYKYDDFNRLSCSNLASNGTCTAPTNGTPTYSYDYDRFGNRWHQNGPRSSQLGFDANNRITGVTGVGYDAAGNMTSDGSGPGTHNYFYDAENRIIQVDGTLGTCSTATACYIYDGDGRRIRKTVSGTSTDFLYDLGDRVVAEMSSTGAWNRGEIFAAGRHIATYNNSTTYFIHADWLGTERVRTQVSGSVCETTASLPFGDVTSTSGSCQPSPNFFTGKERDPESGLDNFGARYDASSLGRFMSPDPVMVSWRRMVNPQVWNAYSYAGNNPLRYVDPTGEELVQLGQHTDDEIKKRQKEIKQELKNKDLSKAQKDALKKERNTLNLEQQGNQVVGNMLADLNKRDPGNGLKLSDFTLSTDTKNDFAGKLSEKDLKSALGAQAFVPRGYGALSQSIYIRTEPSTGFYQMSQINSDFVHYGASALVHEGAHRFSHFNEWNAFYVQDMVFHEFKNDFRNPALYEGLDETIHKGMQDNQP